MADLASRACVRAPTPFCSARSSRRCPPDAVDHDFIASSTDGFAEVREALLTVPVEPGRRRPTFRRGRRALRRHDRWRRRHDRRVELGIQQGVNSTLNSYLEKLLIMLTGSFGRKGTNRCIAGCSRCGATRRTDVLRRPATK